MGILLFSLLALGVAVAIVYPLLPGRTVTSPQAGASDEQIETAVRRVQQRRAGAGPAGAGCPACGEHYRPGDAFCVRCGTALPEGAQPVTEAAGGGACPACGAALHAGDEFCVKCGQALHAAGEAI